MLLPLSNEKKGSFTASRIFELEIKSNITEKQLIELNRLQNKERTPKQQILLEELIEKRDTLTYTKGREKYIFAKAKEAVQGYAKSFSTKQTEHGNLNEYEAISEYAKLKGYIIEYLNQTYYPINDNCGATPDAAVYDFDGKIIASCDVKCPSDTFFEQKYMFVTESKPQYQNVPKMMFYQAQMQMMALTEHNKKLGHPPVDKHYLVRYLTNWELLDNGDKVEIDLPIDVRLFDAEITKDEKVCAEILSWVESAAKERDLLIQIFKQPIIKI